MANLLKLKRSAVAGKVPTTSDLANLGEVGLNTNDGRLFMREDDGTARVHELSAPRTFKAACRVATTANITLSGTQTIDGVAVVAGDRVLVKAQNTGADNGIYECASGAWTRALDFDASNDLGAGVFTIVREGTANADTAWTLTTNAAITLGTTSLTFAQLSGGSGTPGGSDTQIQFNDGGSFGGDADLTWNKTTNLLDLNGDLRLKAQGDLRFADSDSSNYVALQAPATLAADNTYTLPTDYPASNGQVLSSTTAGVLSWVTDATGGGGVTIGTNVTDILSIDGSGVITADDAGTTDQLVFWDDSASKLTYLSVGSGLSISGTTITATGGGGGGPGGALYLNATCI